MYAFAQEPGTLSSTPTRLQSSLSLPSRSRSMSSTELETLASQPSKPDSIHPAKSPSKYNTSSWVDGGTQPKIFPGIVHERTRRSSVKQGSTSDKDMELINPLVKASSRLGPAALADDDGGDSSE